MKSTLVFILLLLILLMSGCYEEKINKSLNTSTANIVYGNISPADGSFNGRSSPNPGLPPEETIPILPPNVRYIASRLNGIMMNNTLNYKLYSYPFGNSSFSGSGLPVFIGNPSSGLPFWSGYRNVFLADWTRSGYPNDILILDSRYFLRLYNFLGTTQYTNYTTVGNGFDFSNYLVGEWTRDGIPDLVCVTNSGDLKLYPFNQATNTFLDNGGGVVIGSNFNFTDYFVADWNGDGSTDLVCRDSGGTLYFYPFLNNSFINSQAGKIVGHGFNFQKYFIGESTGDGYPDLVGLLNGSLYLYPFKDTFYRQGGGGKMGPSFSYSNYYYGDWSGDGVSDMVTRDSNGTLFYFKYNRSSRTFDEKRQAGVGFGAFDLFPGRFYR